MRQIEFRAGQRRQMPHVIELAGRLNRSGDIALDEAECRVVRQMRDVRARPGDQVIQPDDFSSIQASDRTSGTR